MSEPKYYQRHNGGYFELSEMTESHAKLFPVGGGMCFSVPVENFAELFTESELPTALTCMNVELDSFEQRYVAWTNPAVRWNGWLIAYVSFEDCLKILEATPDQLVEDDEGYLLNTTDGNEYYMSRCKTEGLESFYYLDGFCFIESGGYPEGATEKWGIVHVDDKTIWEVSVDESGEESLSLYDTRDAAAAEVLSSYAERLRSAADELANTPKERADGVVDTFTTDDLPNFEFRVEPVYLTSDGQIVDYDGTPVRWKEGR